MEEINTADKVFVELKLLEQRLDDLKKDAVKPAGATPPQARPAAGVSTDLGLTAEEDRAHNQLEGERREFKKHYDALERDFETREKELMDEIRALRENETRMALKNEKLSIDLSIARQRREAAESKAAAAAKELMELDVYNKSAASAVREKDREISDLKQALEEARSVAGRGGGRP